MASDKTTKTKRVRLRPALLFTVLFGAVALVAAWKIADYLIDERESLDYWDELRESVVIMDKTEPPTEKVVEPSPTPDVQEPVEESMEPGEPVVDPSIPAAIDFNSLQTVGGSVVAWIFAPDTKINYAVAQSGDNDYYLRRLLNGKGAISGTIFADYRCSADFTDWNTIVYGHYMSNGTMFGSLANYLDQAYYEEHPVMYLYIPGQRYRLELIAGYTTDVNDLVYHIPDSREERDEVLARAVEKSTFLSDVTVGEEDKLVTLSTCSYAFNNARYVVIGRLVEV